MKRLLILLTLVSLAFGQGWNTWNTWNSWLGRMRYLVPTDNLALFVNPGAQMIDNAKPNHRYPALLTGQEQVDNSDFHDFTIDYPSIGEPNPHYESDFSAGTDGWGVAGGTHDGNIDGIDGEDDVLRFTSDASYSIHRVSKNVIPDGGQYYKITAKIYIPSTNTTMKKVTVGYDYVLNSNALVDVQDSWESVDFELRKPVGSSNWLHFLGVSSSNNVWFTGTSGDVFYVKDIKVQRVGLVAWWQFDSYYHAQEGTGKTILQDLSGNGYDLTASTGFDYSNQLTGDDPVYRNGNALEFDGVDDYAYRPAAIAEPFNPGTGDFSMLIMFKTPFLDPYWNGVFSKGLKTSALSGTFGFLDVSGAGNAINFNIASNAGGSWTYAKTISNIDNGWHTAVFVRSGDDAYFYVDGVLQDYQAGVLAGIDLTNSYDLTIGAWYNGTRFINTSLASAAYFNRALSATEVQALYGKPKYWTWNETGSISNNNFKTELSGGAELTQDITVDKTLYKEQKISTADNDVDYFGNATSHTITLDDGTWSYAGVKDVTNVSAPNTTVIDYSGNGNNGTAQGGLETNQPVHPYAWEFDGVDDYVDFGDVLNIKDHSAIIPFWFKTSSTKTYLPLFGKNESATSNGFTFYLSVGYFRLNVGDGTNSTSHYFDSIDHRDGEWYFGTLIYDSQNTKWLVYLDAEFVGDWVSPYTYFENTDHFRVGKFWGDLYEGQLSLLPYYLFDGQDGRASVMPSNYVDHYIKKIYNNTERYFK